MDWHVNSEVQVRKRCSAAGAHWPGEQCPCRHQDGWLYEWVNFEILAKLAIKDTVGSVKPERGMELFVKPKGTE